MRFDNGAFYWIREYAFKTDTAQPYYSSFDIPGSAIEIRYYDTNKKSWIVTSNTANLPFETLFIQTNQYSMVLGVPALYQPTANNTRTILRAHERPLTITPKPDGTGYRVQLTFKQAKNTFGEIWVVQSASPLVDWTKPENAATFSVHNLEWKARWTMDGYYFPAPTTYRPGGGNVYYCNPASYTAASFVAYPTSPLSHVLGYAMTKTTLRNQNELGYFPTNPESLWLSTDFGITANFYDTRFNTDFANVLLTAYFRYGDTEFLFAARRYIEFFLQFAEENHYDVNGGWLVEDYWGADKKVPTHVSLNHQLAEINYLIRHYKATGDERCFALMNLMLDGIRNTEAQWYQSDGNLRYGLMYTGTFNVLRDYPYLTYNDLFETKRLLALHFNREEAFINNLMAFKKTWMDRNGVTEYRK